MRCLKPEKRFTEFLDNDLHLMREICTALRSLSFAIIRAGRCSAPQNLLSDMSCCEVGGQCAGEPYDTNSQILQTFAVFKLLVGAHVSCPFVSRLSVFTFYFSVLAVYSTRMTTRVRSSLCGAFFANRLTEARMFSMSSSAEASGVWRMFRRRRSKPKMRSFWSNASVMPSV